jgi:copper chaperone CopZ
MKAEPPRPTEIRMKRELKITGMSCQHCVRAVTEALTGVQGLGVETVEIGRAAISLTSDSQLEEARLAIEEEGFQVASVGDVATSA